VTNPPTFSLVARFLKPGVFIGRASRFWNAWAQLEARDPFRDRDHDWIRQAVLRKQIIDNAGTGRIEFDTLYEKVLGDMPTAP
jgi:hypothetical protein